MTCDMNRVHDIQKLSDEEFVHIIEQKGTRYEQLLHPCKDYILPYMLGFNYFHYLGDVDKAVAYYKVASFDQDTPPAARTMPAIMRSTQGKHLISAQLWLDKAISLEQSAKGDSLIE